MGIHLSSVVDGGQRPIHHSQASSSPIQMSKESDPFANMPKDKEDHAFATTMNGRPMPLPLRRIQRITTTPVFKLVAAIILILLGIRWVLDHNYNNDDWPGSVRPTMSVESRWIKWDNKQYIQIVAGEEKLNFPLQLEPRRSRNRPRAQQYLNSKGASS